MKRPLMILLAALGLTLWGGTARSQTADQDEMAPAAAPAQPGVEVLTRGPVHEAFAEPVVRAPAPSPAVPKQPPDPIEEVPSDMKPASENVLWIPGYWAWEDDRQDFVWVSGIWRSPPPDRQWTPGYWTQVEGGWQWVPGFWASTEQANVNLLPEPPEPVAEAPPPQPDQSSTYVPGCWVWRETRYAWRPGFWVQLRPGWVWVSASYTWTPAGYVFVDGYWDYALRDRGLLFAPVVVDRTYWGRPNWFYRPSYVVYDSFLLGALFVRPDHCHYYFGDYFEPRYKRAGYVAWVDFRIGRRAYDPLFSYYTWHNRDNPRWGRELEQVYVGRYRGDIPRPPRTYAAATKIIQNTTINNTTINNITNITNITQVAPVAPVTRVKQTFNLQRVPQAQLTDYRAMAVQFRDLSQERRKLDVQMRQRGEVATATSRPVAVPLTRPKMTMRQPQAAQAPPPAPTVPHVSTTQVPATTRRPEPGRAPERGATVPGAQPGGVPGRERTYGREGTNPAMPRPVTPDERTRRADERAPTTPGMPPRDDRRLTSPTDRMRPGEEPGRNPRPTEPGAAPRPYPATPARPSPTERPRQPGTEPPPSSRPPTEPGAMSPSRGFAPPPPIDRRVSPQDERGRPAMSPTDVRPGEPRTPAPSPRPAEEPGRNPRPTEPGTAPRPYPTAPGRPSPTERPPQPPPPSRSPGEPGAMNPSRGSAPPPPVDRRASPPDDRGRPAMPPTPPSAAPRMDYPRTSTPPSRPGEPTQPPPPPRAPAEPTPRAAPRPAEPPPRMPERPAAPTERPRQPAVERPPDRPAPPMPPPRQPPPGAERPPQPAPPQPGPNRPPQPAPPPQGANRQPQGPPQPPRQPPKPPPKDKDKGPDRR